MRTRAASPVLLTVCTLLALVSCDDGSDDEELATSLCPTVQAWSDVSVDAVDAFRIASRGLDDEGQRRARYVQAFDELVALLDRFSQELDDVDLPDDVDAALDQARANVAAEYDDGRAEAEGLPDSAYEFVAVRDGSLVTGVEKAKAIVFAALAELSQQPGAEIPPGCGRRGALDLSPSATFPS